MELFLRIFLPVYLILMFVFAIGGRAYIFKKWTGVNPYSIGGVTPVHRFTGSGIKFVSVLVLAEVVVFSFFPGVYDLLSPLPWLEHRFVSGFGCVVLIASFVWILVAQAQMGSSWRIGIDDRGRTKLIRTGLFNVSRNPIFLGMRAVLLGLFLITPNAVSLASLFLGEGLLQVQVRLEEEYLRKVHGDSYDDYTGKVRRWI